jgi:hypothetical protein
VSAPGGTPPSDPDDFALGMDLPEPAPVRGALERVLEGMGGAEAPGLVRLAGAWDELVGADLAAVARPSAIEDGVLTIAVRDPAWVPQVRFLERTLVARVEALLGAGVVARVRVRTIRS